MNKLYQLSWAVENVPYRHAMLLLSEKELLVALQVVRSIAMDPDIDIGLQEREPQQEMCMQAKNGVNAVARCVDGKIPVMPFVIEED